MADGHFRRRTFCAGVAAFGLGAPLLAAPAIRNPKAHALLISMTYPDSEMFLPNPGNDATLLEQSFRELSFGSVTRLAEPDGERLQAGVAQFMTRLDPDSLAFIYISGHGCQIDGLNYFMLGDAKTFVELNSLIGAVRSIPTTVILFLDACRNNPFAAGQAGALATRQFRAITLPKARDAQSLAAAAEQGIAFKSFSSTTAVKARVGTFELQGTGARVVFATDPTNVALDGASAASRNSPFAMSLAKRLKEKRSLDDVVSLMTGDVVRETGGAQAPWSQGSIGIPIFLAGQPKATNPAKPPFMVPG